MSQNLSLHGIFRIVNSERSAFMDASKAKQFNLMHWIAVFLIVILMLIAFYVQPGYLCVNLIFICIELYFFIVGLIVKTQGKFHYLHDFFDGYVKKENYTHACNRFFQITSFHTIFMISLAMLFIVIKLSIFSTTILFITSFIIYCILLCGLLKKYDESQNKDHNISFNTKLKADPFLFEEYLHIDDVD